MSQSAPLPQDRLAAVRLLILDVDGIMTDGRIHYDAEGREQKVFHVHDGHGIKQLIRAGVAVAVISGRESRAVETRMQELGIEHVRLGEASKRGAFDDIVKALGVEPSSVACMGDDVPDLDIMQVAGLAITVKDAQAVVIEQADWCTTKGGGRGAVREVCDALIAARRAAGS